VSATSTPVSFGLVAQSVSCPAGKLAVGGGVRFTDAGGAVRDGMVMSTVPVSSPPTGWAASGSTQYTTAGGNGVGDRILVFAVCAAADTSVTSVSVTSTPVSIGLVAQSVSCPAGKLAVGGGVRFTDAGGAARDGMVMSTVPVGNPPAAWAASGSTQYTTAGGNGVGDRILVFAVCTAAPP
jgi:hypothetical protein